MSILQHIYGEWMEAYQKEKIEKILKLIKYQYPVLDVGCGPGFLERFIENIISVDNDVNYVRNVKHGILASGAALPFKSNVFKTVFCIDSIHLFGNGSELLRVAAPGGLIVVGLFCNRYNSHEVFERLESYFPAIKIENRFLIQTAHENEAIITLIKPCISE